MYAGGQRLAAGQSVFRGPSEGLVDDRRDRARQLNSKYIHRDHNVELQRFS